MTATERKEAADAATASEQMNGIASRSHKNFGKSLSSVRGHLMFLGHFGLGLGAKKAVPEVSLGTLFLACQFADLLWPTLVLLGVERVEIEPGATRVTPLNFVSYPYSHGLLMLCVWGIAFGVIYAAIRRSRWRAAVALALLV